MPMYAVVLIYIATILICYLIGAIPNGLIIGKLKHQDIRELGSHNTGGTNAGRVLGYKYGVLTIALDAIKIVIPFWLIKIILGNIEGFETYITNLQYIALMVACLAHCFPVYIGFKGGKAVATFLGCLIATNWFVLIIFVLVFAFVLIMFKYVSLASISSSLFAALLLLVLYLINPHIYGVWPDLESSILLVIAITFNAMLLLIRHNANIKRLINHEESKIKWLK